MSTDSQFWWNWWVNLGVAVGTLAAAFVAIFGDWIRVQLFPPKLKLQLRSSVGEKTPVTITSQTETGEMVQRTEDGRYYHVTVSNEARWPKATEVQIYLLRIDEPGPGGQMQLKWSGEVPLRWRHYEIYPLARTIGRSPADVDLCGVVKNKWVQLFTVITPYNLATIALRREAVKMVVSLQARAAEGASATSRFQIAWDGQWEDGDLEMTRHLTVTPLTEQQ